METTTILLIISAFFVGFSLSWVVSRKKLEDIISEKSALNTRLELTQSEADNLRDEIEHIRSEKTGLHERVVIAEARNTTLQKELEKTEEKLRSEFQNTASNIFENFSNKFSTQSEKQIGDLLSPLKERLGEFQKMISDSFSVQGKEQHSLKTEIEKIVLQTDGLTKALRGDVKAQGNWGEIMLEKILEQSGLRSGEDYIMQASGMGLSGGNGERLKPDVIINLPDNKHIIIDSKVSLTAYERYCNEIDELSRQAQLKELIKSLKAHINGLEQKRYQSIEKLESPDFVMMFMPIEGAFSLALQSDSELHRYAWDRKIAIVCPTTLFATLRTVASLWSIERGNKNALEITRQSGALYDKFVGFIDDMEAIQKNINSLHKSFDSASNRLKDGRGNIMNQIENLKKLGAKAAKSLPQSNYEEEAEEYREVIGLEG